MQFPGLQAQVILSQKNETRIEIQLRHNFQPLALFLVNKLHADVNLTLDWFFRPEADSFLTYLMKQGPVYHDSIEFLVDELCHDPNLALRVNCDLSTEATRTAIFVAIELDLANK